MVSILTGTAFDAQRRMNHREDEVALEFPSGVSSRARGLLALKAINWIAAIKGDDMETVTCDTNCTNMAQVATWAGKFGDNIVLVAKVGGEIRKDLPFAITLCGYGYGGIASRYRGGVLATVQLIASQACDLRVGDEYYIFRTA